MGTEEWVAVVLVFTLAGLALFLGIRSLTERGVLLNNGYLYASKEERKTMNKKPYYRQSGIVFCMLSAVFTVVGLSVVFDNRKLLLVEIPLFAGLILYAVISSIRINAKR
ncbi:MAG: DUF3784 domain-containing protein [Clostridia bacterium]|nr:DUF3784 domain-containing protein [Clostridia bacterium]